MIKLNGQEIDGEIAPMEIISNGPPVQGKMLVIHDDTTVSDGDVVQDRHGNEWWVIPNPKPDTDRGNIHQLNPKTE